MVEITSSFVNFPDINRSLLPKVSKGQPSAFVSSGDAGGRAKMEKIQNLLALTIGQGHLESESEITN